MLTERYSQLWKELLAEGRAFDSHCLTRQLMAQQQAHIQTQVKGRVLDLGAGDLSYQKLMEEYASSYISLDIEVANPNLHCLGDGERLPFASNSFDVIFCAEVLEHTPHPWRMTEEIHRVLKPDGILVMYVPFIYYLHGEPHDYFRFSPHSFKVLLGQFSIQDQGKIGGLVSFVGMLLQNIFLALFYRGLLRPVVWQVNRLLSSVLVKLDQVAGMSSKFPVVLYVIAKKNV